MKKHALYGWIIANDDGAYNKERFGEGTGTAPGNMNSFIQRIEQIESVSIRSMRVYHQLDLHLVYVKVRYDFGHDEIIRASELAGVKCTKKHPKKIIFEW